MSTDNWSRIKRIFQEAFELPPADRDAFLDEACQEDGALRAEVETLLAAHGQEGDLLQSPTAASTVDGVPMEGPGTTIGRYKLLQRIGEGGFGSVYMAEQERPVRRKVALKVIKLGMDTRQVIARFEAERQALALMDHPNIARVLDAGATATGRPYFVMELVRGVPITDYCDQNHLPMRQRLDLFQSVCSAVQHAHQKGIIHRDIKPHNVMVTLHDGAPVPKVIDFGIAKATNQKLTEKTLFTEYHQFVGTPQYMSPEQAEMSGLDVDTRTDIYALGVLLYELLTGTTPFDPTRLRSMAYTEIHRVIREEEPDRPSTRVSTLGEAATETAKHRATDAAALRRALSGDLDWIVMKAIEKDRTRRYDTANSLRLDIVRYLGSEPVLAGPPSAAYRVRKLLRRNRGAVIVAGTVVAALLLGTGLATYGFLEASRERSAARAEAEAAEAINDFFTDMLASVDPNQYRLLSAMAPEHGTFTAAAGTFEQKMTVAEMLARAGERVEETFRDQPALEAEVHETISGTLHGLGERGAGRHMRRALEIRRSILPEDHPDRLRIELIAAYASGDSDRLREVRDGFERVYGPDHPKTLSATTLLAKVLTTDRSLSPGESSSRSKFAAAGDLFRATLEKQREILGNEHPDTLTTMLEWAIWYEFSSRGEEAEGLAREAYDTTRRILSPNHTATIRAAATLGWALNFQGRHEEARGYLEEALEKQTRFWGPDHPALIHAMTGLARSLNRPEELDEKEALWRRATELSRGCGGTWIHGRDLAFLLVRRGKEDEGIGLMRRTYEDCLAKLGQQNSITTHSEDNLLSVLRAAGRHEEARNHLRAKLEELRRQAAKEDATAQDLEQYAAQLLTVWPPDLRQPGAALQAAERAAERAPAESSGRMLDTLARARYGNDDLPGAIEAQRKAVEATRAHEPDDVESRLVELVRYLTLAGEGAGASEEVERQVRIWREDGGVDPAALARKLHDLGRSLDRQGLWEAAAVPLAEAMTIYEQSSATDPEDQVGLLVELSRSHLGQGDLAEASELLTRAEDLSVQAHGPGSADHAAVLREIAGVLSQFGHDREALPLIRQSVEVYAALGGEENRARRGAEGSLAFKLVRLGETEEAARIARQLIDFWQKERGDSDSMTGLTRFALALAELQAGDVGSAEQELRRSLDVLRRNRHETESPVLFAEVEAALAECLRIRGRHDEAGALLTRAYERVDEHGRDSPRIRREILDDLVALYEAWGRAAEAARWREIAANAA